MEAVCCDSCSRWIHKNCQKVPEGLIEALDDEEIADEVYWFCKECKGIVNKSIKGQNIREITNKIEKIAVLKKTIKEQGDQIERLKKHNQQLNVVLEKTKIENHEIKQQKEILETHQEVLRSTKETLEKHVTKYQQDKISSQGLINSLLDEKSKSNENNKQLESSKNEITELKEVIRKYVGDVPMTQIKDISKELKMKESEMKKAKSEIAEYKEKLEVVVREKEDSKRTLENLNEYLDKIKEVNESLEIQLREQKDNGNKQQQAMQKSEINKNKQGKEEIVNSQEESRSREKTREGGEVQENIREQRKKKLCRNYQRYKECNYGTECKFEHVDYQIKECKFYKEGKCRYGNKCKYNHTEEIMKALCWSVKRKEICEYGERCHFRHTTIENERDRGERNTKETKLLVNGNETRSTSEKSEDINSIKEHVEKRFDFLCQQIQTMETWMKQRLMLEQQNQIRAQRWPYQIQLQGQSNQMHAQQPILNHQQKQQAQ
eukprot:Seg6643.2 transcript_id=Seg6643.2/GoldUCD/mRNA.D3Y31 product="hypothetical protein" protein_id=Seg6643.2/GoldUCD/D3Y31